MTPPPQATAAVPLRLVFPWWYLAGLVATFALIELLGGGGAAAVVAAWGPAIGVEIARRRQYAARRQQDGLPVRRRDLAGPWWIEVITAIVFVVLDAGIALTLGSALSGVGVGAGVGRARLHIGIALLAFGVLGFLGLAARARYIRQRRRELPDGDR